VAETQNFENSRWRMAAILKMLNYYILMKNHPLLREYDTQQKTAARQLALAVCSRTCTVQARRNSAPVSATQSPVVPN